MPIIKLTQQFISNHLQCPASKNRIEYCDEELPGLYVEVRFTSPGQGTYYLRYKDDIGKTCHQKISRTNEINLTEVRKQARTLKAEISLGANPRAEEKARKTILTFTEFFEQHYLPYVKPRKRSWDRGMRNCIDYVSRACLVINGLIKLHASKFRYSTRH